MQKVLTAEEMREVDRLTTEEYGIPSIILMENAAHALARVITEKLGGSVKGKCFLILCGKGNNGGDGAALARILSGMGARVYVHLYGTVEETKNDAKINFEILKNINLCEIKEFREFSSKDELNDWWSYNRSERTIDVIVDAVFGTGLTRPMEAGYITFLEYARDYKVDIYDSLIVSIDLPSGLDADRADSIGYSIDSDITVTLTAPKLANVLPPAIHDNGELYVGNIGSPVQLIDQSPSKNFVAEKTDARHWLSRTRFSDSSYKNKRGNALLIVGSKKYTGAAVLAGNGAMQSGAGMVTVATAESAANAVSERILPEVMVRGVAVTPDGSISEDAFEEIGKIGEKADAVAIGSGLDSSDESTRKLVRKVIEKRTTPVVIDADGLNALSPFELKGSEKHPLILTPHEGEFLRLIGTEDKEAVKDRVSAVRDFARNQNVILVLKGERTLIGEPGGTVVINPTGNAGLGKAGNGDNLTGIITGFIAQAVQAEVDIFETVVAAVYIAGLAADIAEKKFGKRVMLASDVRDCMVEAFREIEIND